MEEIRHKELTWGVIAGVSIVLGIVNLHYPLSSWKILVVSVTALLLSLYQILESFLNIYISEKKLNTQLNQLCTLVDVPNAEFGKEKQMKTIRCFASALYAISIVVLIAGLFLDVPIQEPRIADAISLISLGLVFLSLCINSCLSKNLGKHDVISHDLEKAKAIIKTKQEQQ